MVAQISRSRAVSSRQLGAAADVHVGARFAFRGDAVEAGHRLAVDEDDALVALAHLGQVTLDHERLAEALLEQLDQRREVVVALLDEEHAGAAIAVERLDDDVAVLLAEGVDQRRGRASPASAASARGTR